MKIKVMRRDTELIIDYAREKSVYLLRHKILKYLSNRYEGNLVIYINTNNKRSKAPHQNIKKILENLDLDFRCEPAEKIKRNFLDLSWLFVRKSKGKDMSANLILIKLTMERSLERLYDDLLQYFDYGVGCVSKKSLDEMLPVIKNDPSKLLFNKNYFSSTLYDSAIFYRMRIDYPYEDLAGFIENMDNKNPIETDEH